MDVTQLRNSTVAELQGYADALKVPHGGGLRKQDLIFRIHQGLARKNETAWTRGVLDVLPDGNGFLRSPEWNYLAAPGDVHVPAARIAQTGLRRGDTIFGSVRPSGRGGRFLTLTDVERVNGRPPEHAAARPAFEKLRPTYPDQRLTLEIARGNVAMRIVDLVAPVGLGQRGLIVSPPKAGKTTILRNMANAISANHPGVQLLVLLIDERPEEVTEMTDAVHGGEVVASTFDEPAVRHRQVAEMVLEKAKRHVEYGRDVVILLDSVTRLARAYNTLARHSGRILSGGVDANALQWPKKFFGSARKIMDGGSLTIVATALVETGSRMDEVIFEEFKGTGNMELVLDRETANQRIFPAIDLNRSGTRREEMLLSSTELNRVYVLRNFLSSMPAPEAAQFLLDRIGRQPTNAAFLAAMAAGE